MKTLKIYLLLLLAGIALHPESVYAQKVKKNKDAVQEAAIKKLIESKSYTFLAQSVTPLRGRNVSLSYGYDLRVNKDTVVAYLPFFGRAFIAPIDPMDNGIEFTSTKFTYTSVAKKNGYLITIKPADTKDVRQLFLDVSSNGYASLRIINLSRDAITFEGYIQPYKKD